MKKIFLMLAATMLLALPALAVTQAEVQAEATAVFASYDDLSDRVDACPDGQCSGAQALVDELAVLEAQRATLHADRESLGTCGCTQLDALIAQIDQLSDVLSATFGGWDETS